MFLSIILPHGMLLSCIYVRINEFRLISVSLYSIQPHWAALCSHLDKLTLGVFLCGFHLQSRLQTLLQHRAGHRSPVFLRHHLFPLSLWLEPGSTLERQVQKTAGAVGKV